MGMVPIHTCFVKFGRQTWNQKLLQQTVAHTAGNIHEMHKQVVFGVESLHLTVQYPCNSWSAHVSAQPTTKKLMAAVRV